MQWPTLIAPLRADKTSGAAELARKAAVAVLQWLDQAASRPFAALSAELLAFAAALYRAQPAMAPLFNLVNEVLLAAESARTSEELQQRIRGGAQRFLGQMEQANARLAMASTALFPSGACVLTFSYSSTVLGVLRQAQAQQRLSKVFCTESRPMQEGQRLARQLAAAGIAVQFGVDAAMATFAPQATMALVGADSLTAQGVVNKLGTTGLTLVARHVGIPCYVVADRHKWFPAAAAAPAFAELKPAAEVWPEAPEGVTVWNAYFEATPLELFSGIIGEQGLLDPDDFRQRLSAMPMARAWRSVIRTP